MRNFRGKVGRKRQILVLNQKKFAVRILQIIPFTLPNPFTPDDCLLDYEKHLFFPFFGFAAYFCLQKNDHRTTISLRGSIP